MINVCYQLPIIFGLGLWILAFIGIFEILRFIISKVNVGLHQRMFSRQAGSEEKFYLLVVVLVCVIVTEGVLRCF